MSERKQKTIRMQQSHIDKVERLRKEKVQPFGAYLEDLIDKIKEPVKQQ